MSTFSALKRDAAALRHGVARVHAEVEQHLVQLRGIAQHRPKVGRKIRLDVDVARESLRHDLGQLADEMLELEQHALAFHAARKGEHLLDDARAAFRAALDDVQHLQRVLVLEFPAQDAAGHQDRRQDIVQVVGNAAGQRADALEALRAEELRLELLRLGHIGIDHQHGFRLAVVVAHQRPAAVDDDRTCQSLL